MVVDDDSAVREMLKMLLTFDGHEVQTADSGEAALAELEHNTFDLILTDYSMPGMNGNQLAAIVKQSRPDQPVIMVTGHAAGFHHAGNPSMEVDYIIGKPFALADLREAIVWVMSPEETQPTASDQPATSPTALETAPTFWFPPTHSEDFKSGRMRP